MIAIPVINNKITEGYLPLLDAGEGLFIGNAAVSVNDGQCLVMAINTSESEICVQIHPQEIIPCDIDPSEASEPDEFLSTFPTIEKLSETERINLIKSKISTEHLNTEQIDHIYRIINEFPELFYLPGVELPGTNLVQHDIPTIDDIPVIHKQYRYPPVHKQEVRRQLEKLLTAKVIKNSSSPYNSPLWIVPKKRDAQGNRQWRMVIDYRALNEKTIGDRYPLPNISEILENLGGAKFFSVFDLASGFHQIPMNPKDSPKTAFSSFDGHYEFLRMPFGLTGAPSSFQRLMNKVLCGMNGVELFV